MCAAGRHLIYVITWHSMAYQGLDKRLPHKSPELHFWTKVCICGNCLYTPSHHAPPPLPPPPFTKLSYVYAFDVVCDNKEFLKLKSWNNGMRCMSCCVLMNLWYGCIASWDILCLGCVCPKLTKSSLQSVHPQTQDECCKGGRKYLLGISCRECAWYVVSSLGHLLYLCNIWGWLCSTVPFKLSWPRGYITHLIIIIKSELSIFRLFSNFPWLCV